MLTKTIEAGLASGAVEKKSLERVAVDTTVMEKNIAHPTDARLYQRARVRLVVLAREAGVPLRQSYARLAPRLGALEGHAVVAVLPDGLPPAPRRGSGGAADRQREDDDCERPHSEP